MSIWPPTLPGSVCSFVSDKNVYIIATVVVPYRLYARRMAGPAPSTTMPRKDHLSHNRKLALRIKMTMFTQHQCMHAFVYGPCARQIVCISAPLLVYYSLRCDAVLVIISMNNSKRSSRQIVRRLWSGKERFAFCRWEKTNEQINK